MNPYINASDTHASSHALSRSGSAAAGPNSPPRLACLETPALPLQLLVHRHSDLNSEHPVAVVDEDRPQGTILWVNKAARRAQVLPGLRYAAGLSLCSSLRAGEVTDPEIKLGVERILERLWHFSPEVEPCHDEPGIFWINASGLQQLEPSLARWARRVLADLRELGFTARAAIGFTRFGTYAMARTVRHVVVVRDLNHEHHRVLNTHLNRLNVEPPVREGLAKLGIHTVGQFLDLPRDGINKRFGASALKLHRLAGGYIEKPLDPAPLPQPMQSWIHLDYPETNSNRLLFIVKRSLHPLLSRVADRHRGLSGLTLQLLLDDGVELSEEICPAAPTLDASMILELVRLKLESVKMTTGVVELALTVASAPVTLGQLELFARPHRDLSAANRSFARLRAEFGDKAVVCARLQERHLPEATFTWRPLREARLPRPCESEERPLVRRIFDRPQGLPTREQYEPDGWLIGGLERGPVIRLLGPYVISGGWWSQKVHREYHFVETQRGDVLWVYYDQQRRQWNLHGLIE